MNTPDRKLVLRQPWRVCAWIHSGWVLMSLGGTVAMATAIGLATGAPVAYLSGQSVLGLCVYLALYLLADRPLLNPVQFMVAYLYWLLGFGPAVVAAWSFLVGRPEAALHAEVSGMEALWIVAPGVLVYAAAARFTLHWFAKTGLCARFLLPAGDNYRPQVLLIYVSLTLLSTLTLKVLSGVGIQGEEQMSYLGGTKTNIWWVGVISAVALLSPFVTSALMTALATPWKTIPKLIRILIGVTVVQTVVSAAFGGWKAPLAVLGATYVFAYLSRRQRPPWVVLTVGTLVFLLVIAPFVGYGRNVAERAKAGDAAERTHIFSELLKNPEAFLPTGAEELEPALLFRGVSPIAGELTRRNGFLEGEWHGYTITWGFEVLVPRVFMPGKRDQNLGNFFSRTVGADLGITEREGTENAICVGVPFEFVGNYGLAAGILSFGLIGVFWALLCGWLLSPARLSNHSLTPFLVLTAMGVESCVGPFLAGFRNLSIPLLICFFVYIAVRRKL